MCQCRFLVGEICIILVSGVGNGGGFASVGAGGNRASLYLPLNFVVNKTALTKQNRRL